MRAPALDALQRQSDGSHDAAQARIRCERLKERARFRQLAERFLQLALGQKEKAVSPKERAARGLPDALNDLFFLCKLFGELVRRVICEFRRRAVNNGDDCRFRPWKRLEKSELSLPPWQIIGYELADIGIDFEPASHIGR